MDLMITTNKQIVQNVGRCGDADQMTSHCLAHIDEESFYLNVWLICDKANVCKKTSDSRVQEKCIHIFQVTAKSQDFSKLQRVLTIKHAIRLSKPAVSPDKDN